MNKRKTIQKQMIFDSVCNLCDHPTAEEVYNTVSEIHPNISKGTVYRNLHLLAEEGEIKRISIPDSADRFDKTTSPHYHIKCFMCERFADIAYPYMDNLNSRISKDTGYLLEEHDIVFTGICPDCKKNNFLRSVENE